MVMTDDPFDQTRTNIARIMVRRHLGRWLKQGHDETDLITRVAALMEEYPDEKLAVLVRRLERSLIEGRVLLGKRIPEE
jgi:hypothetical protein